VSQPPQPQPPPQPQIVYLQAPPKPLYRRVATGFFALLAAAVLGAVASTNVAWGLPPKWQNPSDKELRPYVSTVELALQGSAPMRAELEAVTTAINNCRIWPKDAAARIAGVRDDRQKQLGLLQSVPPPDAGVDLRQRLYAAYTASSAADKDLIAWLNGLKVAHPQDLCGYRDQPLFQDYVRESRRALAAKKDFVAAFDPVARNYNLPSDWSEWNF
jgi:hypothetical protein